MMKVITGEVFNTSFGKIIAYNEQHLVISVGEPISFNGGNYVVKEIIPPTKPDGLWSLCV